MNPAELQDLLLRLATEARPFAAHGRVADYIPALASVDPSRFGIALATVDGTVVGSGDFETRFSIQSVSKAFSLALVLARDGETLWSRVGREPSGNPFNSLVQLEYEQGVPRNPFINAGALVVVDRMLSHVGDAVTPLLDFLRAESGAHDVAVDPEVARSEASHGHRNAALAHFMASYGNLVNPVATVLDHYVRHCAIAMSCRELARGSSSRVTGSAPTARSCSRAARPSASTPSCSRAARTMRRATSPTASVCQARAASAVASSRSCRGAAASWCGVPPSTAPATASQGSRRSTASRRPPDGPCSDHRHRQAGVPRTKLGCGRPPSYFATLISDPTLLGSSVVQ